MVLNCIFLMTDDVEHLFMCLFAIHVSSLVKFLFKPFAHLFLGVRVLNVKVREFLYILQASPLADTWFAKLLSSFVACLFIPLTVSFED